MAADSSQYNPKKKRQALLRQSRPRPSLKGLRSDAYKACRTGAVQDRGPVRANPAVILSNYSIGRMGGIVNKIRILKEGGMKLPKEEYIHVNENGRMITYCTMRQKALHTIGFNSGRVGRRLYTRHGKKYYKPYRNYFCGQDSELDKLVEAGYMDCEDTQAHGEESRTYWFNRCGLDWLGEQTGVKIYDEES